MIKFKSNWITYAIVLSAILIGVLSAIYDQTSAPSNAVKVELDNQVEDPDHNGARRDQNQLENFVAEELIDQQMIDFALFDFFGERVEISPLETGTTIFHFWATWCAPCVVELPELVRKAQESNARFVLISVDADISAIERFMSRTKKANRDINFDTKNIVWLRDPQQVVMRQKFNVDKLPETYVADDAAKKMIKRFSGPADWARLEL
jgi:thiol-disulfide isomerase/thioredoxin